MYLKFFNLRREPFQVTPDPEFFFFSPGHREALAILIYGVEQRKGFVALTGEVGVGKTTILRAFLEKIDRRNTKVIYLLNPNIDFAELLKMLVQELGADPLVDSVFLMVNQMHHHLIERYRQGCNVVLVVDEAQNMPVDTLEGLRVLSNLETGKDKLLQIIFSGQPEFDAMLTRTELRQLGQRIAVCARVMPLNGGDGARYIRHRLLMAGAAENAVFASGAIRSNVKAAGGIPRVLNILCDNALITALGYRTKKVSRRIAREIIVDYRAKSKQRASRKGWAVAGSAVGTLAVVTAFFVVMNFDLLRTRVWNLSDALPQLADHGPSTMNGLTLSPQPAAFAISDAPEGLQGPLVGSVPEDERPADQEESQSVVANVADDTPTNETLQSAGQPSSDEMAEMETVEYVVERGDRLLDLVEKVYGRRDSRLLRLVTQHNSHIGNGDLIRVGDRIVFPPSLYALDSEGAGKLN